MTRFLFCLFLSIVFLTGCGERAEEKAMEKKIEKETGAKADVDLSRKGMKITGETDRGKYTLITGEETEIPKDFPDDVFIYRPSKAVMAMKVPDGYSITLTTSDNRSKILSTYREEMNAKGWSEETSMIMGPQSVLVYKKNDRVANISIITSDKALQITVTVTTK
ncbi:MAG: hypothetical protein KAU41_12470 [Deltaproteobacteria bacterium]|nr:hypothetical protein [Deltaproteobacteria bacterium]